MSFTNSRLVAGWSSRFIIRAATPSMSGSVANSRTLTRITPSRSGIGAGNGSLLCPGGNGGAGWPFCGGGVAGCAAAEAATNNATTMMGNWTMRMTY